jgi:peptidoglycan/xylan/chitin deacetylase (PgdA/CDA1 family)
MLLKGALQFGLPADVRSRLLVALFAEFVPDDERDLARELYLSIAQLRELVGWGMAVGGHGWEHVWLGTLARDEQAREIALTMGLLERVYDKHPGAWTMCYPYGSYDANTLDLLRGHGAALGLTTQPEVVGSLTRPLEIARLDTNDLPPIAERPAGEELPAATLDRSAG